MAIFCGLLGFASSNYDLLSKRDCDYGLEEIQAWKSRNKENPLISKESVEKVDQYARRVIRDLPVALTSSNIQPALEHLVILARQDDILRQKLINHVEEFRADDNIKREIRTKLICTSSRR
ncbi:MAG: hypothetical protein LLG04_07875 [Parachlamydia sp.]|nr:hypothetical protein [Parachlamydia sp.]